MYCHVTLSFLKKTTPFLWEGCKTLHPLKYFSSFNRTSALQSQPETNVCLLQSRLLEYTSVNVIIAFLSLALMCIVRPDGPPQLCKTDQIGEIIINSRAGGTMYYGLPGLTKNTFEVWASGVRPQPACVDTNCITVEVGRLYCLTFPVLWLGVFR